MRLVYTATGKPVNIGDRHTVGGFALVVAHTPQPHKPDSEGKIDFHVEGEDRGPTYYCSVIGAEWIEREDRAGDPRVGATYTPGIGWQYTLTTSGRLHGRFGNFETESQAIAAGRKHDAQAHA